MKNHLAQAIAAIEVAETLGVKLVFWFWINSNRLEGKSDSFLRSIRELFKRFPGHELQEVNWMSHDDFLKLIKSMDIVTQVSNTETFNIVAADAVGQGVPVIGSAEIPWLDGEYIADPGSVLNISKRLLHVLENSKTGLLQADQLQQLRFYTERTKEIWARYLFKA